MKGLCRRIQETFAMRKEWKVLVLLAPNGRHLITTKGPLSNFDIAVIYAKVGRLMDQSESAHL